MGSGTNMSNTYRKNKNYGEKETLVRDSSDEYKGNRNYRKGEKDYIISSLQSDLIKTRKAGKESLRNAGFKVRTRMTHAKTGTANGRQIGAFPLKKLWGYGEFDTIKVSNSCDCHLF